MCVSIVQVVYTCFQVHLKVEENRISALAVESYSNGIFKVFIAMPDSKAFIVHLAKIT